MSLDWSIRGCADVDGLTGDDKERVITEALVWGSMAVALTGITDENASEFFGRLHALEEEYAFIVGPEGEKVSITPEMVYRRVGMTTNVSAESLKKWVSHHPEVRPIMVGRGVTLYDEYLTTLVCQVCDAADMARADLNVGPLDDESIARMQAYIDAAEEEHSCPVK